MAKIKVFLSYSSADRPIAERIHIALVAAGYDVFFDRNSLPAGESYDLRILDAIEESDLLIFLLSTESIKEGAYTLTELGFARRKWPNPGGRILPVVIRDFDLDALPVYLRPVTLLEPKGNVAAEVVSAVHELSKRRWRYAKWGVVALVVLAIAVAIGFYNFQMQEYECRIATSNARASANRIIDYAYKAGQREFSMYEKLYNSYHKWLSDTIKYHYKDTSVLFNRMYSIIEENNSVMSELAKEANQHRAAISDGCSDAYDGSVQESDLSFNNLTEDIYRDLEIDIIRGFSYRYENRFIDYVKLANQLNELVDRTTGVNGKLSE